ncbi:hypothetical protein CALCODRAFT_483783 [Calocera cornea HHB12733]|uniref:Ubiquitin-like protease family profile domain-containing protein n=1 Tax=Calocera cornea HHB12733 TaxID=1353952 RepID=A0A165FEX3_9BASI|nr:hypothetical protein CALCODRAFT_483783 [Calocera cornea HHB12733]
MEESDRIVRQRTVSWLQDQGHDGRAAGRPTAASTRSPPTPARATVNAPPYRVPTLGPRWSSPPADEGEEEELWENSDVYDRVMGDVDVVYEELGGAVRMDAERVGGRVLYADEEVEEEDEVMEDDHGWPAAPRSRCSSPPWPETAPPSRHSSPPWPPASRSPSPPVSRSPSPPWPERTPAQAPAMELQSAGQPNSTHEAGLQTLYHFDPPVQPAGRVQASGGATSTADTSMANMLSGARPEPVDTAGTRPSSFFFQQHEWDEERVREEVAKLEQSAREERTMTAGRPAARAGQSSHGTVGMGRPRMTGLRTRNVFYGHPAPTHVGQPAGPAVRIHTFNDSSDLFLWISTRPPPPAEEIDLERMPERTLNVGYRRLLVTREMFAILHSRTRLLDDQIIDLFGHLFEEGQPYEWFRYVAPAGLPSVRIISPQALAELPYIPNDPELLAAWFDRHFSHVFPRDQRNIHGKYDRMHSFRRPIWLMPVHDLKQTHWVLCRVDFEAKTMSFFNSVKSTGGSMKYRGWIQDCIDKARGVVGIDIPGWAGWRYVDVDVVQQPNKWDCGLWVIANEHSLVRGYGKAPPHDMAVYKRALFDVLASWPVAENSEVADEGDDMAE